MRNRKREKEEHLERLWGMKEGEQEAVEYLEDSMKGDFDAQLVEELAVDGMVALSEGNRKIVLTESGEKEARRIIRAHRIAERLLHNVLGGEFETGACEFEHTVTSELVDSICILLGHPRTCPHGMSIPEGECCRRSEQTTRNMVIPLTEAELNQSARIAYINCRDDHLLHRLDDLQVRPGINVKLHQRYPCFVIECEGASIALDEDIVASICVWSQGPPAERPKLDLSSKEKKPRPWWSKGFMPGRKRPGKI
ncbi:MAG: metal-dependent transcriptional regulator [Deltaproteobacteria bacterium]|nr:metal-dependent transcriptional regulator [Deltaproteobacteria bacterium]